MIEIVIRSVHFITIVILIFDNDKRTGDRKTIVTSAREKLRVIMEGESRQILNRNYFLLTKNIVITDEFYGYLRSYNVLPETMIKDIQAQKTRECRNKKLIELLQIRGCDSFRKLRHVLYLSGHAFLADHLYEEDKNTQFLKAEEVFGKFPSVFNHTNEDTKAKLLRFLESKIREKRLISAWEKTASERCEIQEARKDEFEQLKDVRAKLENKTRQVSQIYNDVMNCRDELKKRELEIETLKREIEEKKRRFKNDLSVQAKFNAANNKCILKLNEKFAAFNARVNIINSKVMTFLEGVGEYLDREADGTKLSYLENNISRVLHVVQGSFDAIRNTMRERQSILKLLNKPEHSRDLLSDIVKRFVDKEEKGKIALYREIGKISDTLYKKGMRRNIPPETADLKLLRNMLATVRVEIEHFQKKLIWKDDQINDMLEELAALKHTARDNVAGTSYRMIPIVTESLSTCPEFAEGKNFEFDKFVSTSREIKPNVTVRRCSSTDSKTDNNTNELTVRKIYSAGDRNLHQQLEEEISEEHMEPRNITFCMHDEYNLQNKVKSTTLPDIIDHENIRAETSSKQNQRKLSLDLTSILQHGENNTELYKMTSLLAKKITENKLPSIFKMGMDVTSSVCDE